MSHFHLERKRAAVAVYRHAKRLKTEHGAKWLSPLELAQSAAGGGSRAQLFRWLKSDLSEDAAEQREESRGASLLLSEDQVSLLVGFACFMRSSLRPLSGSDLQQFCNSHLGKNPSLSTISRYMNEHGFSSQRSMTRNSRMVSEEVVEAALDAILELRSYEFSPDQLLFMDETGLWSNVTQPKTYHFAHWYLSPSSFVLRRFSTPPYFGRSTGPLPIPRYLPLHLFSPAHISHAYT